jgi:MIP family channel proteins
MRHHRLGPALVAEGVGTFVLVFAGCGAIAVGSLHGTAEAAIVAVAFGLAVMIGIYSMGHVSGAHFNPAVTLAFAISGHLPRRRVLPYWAAQVAGALLAAAFLRLSLGATADLGVTQPSGSEVQAVAWEVLLTAMLMLVITSVATDARAVGQAAAIAIGATVALGALVGGPISGASMNPARSLGPALVSGELAHITIYLVAPLVGAAIAALGYDLLRHADEDGGNRA